ncbi:MAG TPA: glycoside hydrolase domain-containing protein [Chitinophagaceae bacterium]|nr:glycoside hydrolase domain-containing protein [Chitinophagaceae bacterium]
MKQSEKIKMQIRKMRVLNLFSLLLSLSFLLTFSNANSQTPAMGLIDSARISRPFLHYQEEFAFDSAIDPAGWQKVSPGLHASFVTTDEVYFRSEVPAINQESLTWKGTGWKGERLNAMLLVWSPDTINQVRLVLNDLKSARGNMVRKDNIQLNKIRYVISNYPYDARDVTCGEGPVDKAYLMPDRFEAFDRFDLPGNTARPVWISIDIPATAIAGNYDGTIELRSEKQVKQLRLSLTVQDQVLAGPKDWAFQLDLWQNPWVIAEYYKVKPWGTEHVDLLKKHLKLYADAGGKFITTYAVHSPWADNSYMIEGSMIDWIKKKDGGWKFDYSIFDKYVQLSMDAGINKAITIYTPIPWGERFRYRDEGSGDYVTERWLPTSAVFRTNWRIFLTDLRKHLEKKGWFKLTYLGINENAMEQTLAAIKVLKEHSKDWKITYAGDWHPELDNLLDDYSCVYGKEPAMGDLQKRTNKKQTTTYYVCCTPPKPNTFVFSPPVEARWLGWYASAYGYDGLLRWAYDAWPADPVRDARHVYWPAGDCFMIYPGGQSSIRFEKMREGIVDFEKIRLLKKKAAGSANPKVKKLLEELELHLKLITKEKEFRKETLYKDIQKGQSLLEELTDLVSSLKN